MRRLLLTLVAACSGSSSTPPDAARIDAARIDAAPLVDGPPADQAADAPAGPHALAVARTGGGIVTGSGGAIDCGVACTTTRTGPVTLTAAADPASTFIGWGGACTGTGPCTVTLDHDTSVSATFSSCSSRHKWTRAFGASRDDRASAVAIDANENTYVAGSFLGAVDLGSGMLAGAGGTDLFVTKLDPSGAPVWAVRYGGPLRDEPLALALTPTGDLVIAGQFEGVLPFGGITLTSSGHLDAFVAKLSGTTGAVVWAVQFGGRDRDGAFGVSVNAAGDVAVAGQFSGPVAFGATILVSAGWMDAFTAKLSGANGGVVWARRAGGGQLDVARAVTFDSAGDVVAVGSVQPPGVDFDGVAFAGHGPGSGPLVGDAFVEKLDATTGSRVWVSELGGIEPDDARAVVAGPLGDIFVVGTFGYQPAGGYDSFGAAANAYAAKLSSAGGVVWTKPLGPSSDELGQAVALTPAGRVIVGGAFDNDVDLGGGVIRNAVHQAPDDMRRFYDAFVVELDASTGAFQRAERFGGIGRDQVCAVAAGPSGIVAAGEYSNTADLCSGLSTANGGTDAFVMAIASTGSGTNPAVLVPPESTPSTPTGPTLCQSPPPAQPQTPAVNGAPSFTERPWNAMPIPIENGIAVGDFDSDGDDDVIVTSAKSPAPDILGYRNDGTGLFAEDTTAMFGNRFVDLDGNTNPGAFTLDINGDGRLDILTLNIQEDRDPRIGAQDRLLVQQSDGTLADETYSRLPLRDTVHFGAAIGDLQCNGSIDLFAPDNVARTTLENDGAGHLALAQDRVTYLPGVPVQGVTALTCDINRDGALDVVYAGNNTTVFLNNGLGELQMQPLASVPQLASGAARFACIDVDLDGWVDLVMLAENGIASSLHFWRNQHDSTFAEVSGAFPDTLVNEGELAMADLNGDGWIDVVASAAGCTGFSVANDAQLFINQGGTFAEEPGFMPRVGGGCIRVVPIDANHDNKADLLVVRIGTSTTSSVLINTTP